MRNTVRAPRAKNRKDKFRSILHILEERALKDPGGAAIRFLYDEAASIAEARFDSWSWKELRDRSRVVARELAATGQVTAGSRVLVVYPPGLGFTAAFLGCLYAGAIPVPVPAPRRAEGINRWLHTARDAGISGMLCPDELLEVLTPLQNEVGNGFCLSPKGAVPAVPCTLEDDGEEFFSPDPDHIAFLQYTSGSTSDPKGVMVTHGNLVTNLGQIATAFEYGPSDRSACWLPHYHDMGLIDGILSPVFNGFPVVLMAPAAFLRRPLRFLQLASDVGATVIGGPNFSYEHCISKFSEEGAAGLDLSAIRIAYNGAEPVRPQTLRRFAETYAPFGFRWKAFYCCYGQAEATLFQTGNGPDDPPRILSVRRDALISGGDAVRAPEGGQDGALLELASCGRPAQGLDLVLVDPDKHERLDDGRIGELWIRGPNVTPGYWGKARLSAETFNQTLDGTDGWRRTGDLGFRQDGQIYITGRLKDVIIIRGQNHHPEDIEQTVFTSHPALAQGRAGAFSLATDGGEQVGVVCELTREGLRDLDTDDVMRTIRGAVSRTHDLKVAVIALIRPSSLPRTPSGKVRRFACRSGILNDDLRIVARWDARPDAVFDDPAAARQATWAEQLRCLPKALQKDGLRKRLQEEVAFLASLPEGELADPETGFFELGLDSLALVSFGSTLESELAFDVQPTLIFEYPTIDALTAHIATALDLGGRATSSRPAELRADGGTAAAEMASSVSSELAMLESLLRKEKTG